MEICLDKIEIAEHIMESPSFIIFEVGLGLLFPLLIAIFGDQEKIGRFCLASIFGLIGLMVARVNVVEAVQLVPKQLLKNKRVSTSTIYGSIPHQQ